MNDDITNHQPNEEEGNGLIFDHPLLAKLDMMDHIVVTAHYASMVKSAVVNTQLITLLRIINMLIMTVHTSTVFSEEQKGALAGLIVHLKQHMEEISANAEQNTDF